MSAQLQERTFALNPANLKHPKIDSDGHVIEPGDLWTKGMPAHLRERGPQAVAADMMTSSNMKVDGELIQRPQHHVGATVWLPKQKERYAKGREANFSVQSHVAGMDDEGIDGAVVYPSRGLSIMGANKVDPEITTAAADVYNRWLAEYCGQSNGRLLGAGMIDPRDVNSARRQARESAEYGFASVFLRPNPVLGKNWFHPDFEPLWSVLEDLDMPIGFHEGSTVRLPQVATERYDEHAFWHACNHPMEQQMAMLSMLMGGVAERHPKLRIAFLECGAGWLPYWLWRLDEHYENEQHKFPTLKMKPSEYAERQCYVSIDSDETPGIAAIELTSKPRVVWGSDYPHPDAKYPYALRTLANLDGMKTERLRQVVWEAPQTLYGDRLEKSLSRHMHSKYALKAAG